MKQESAPVSRVNKTLLTSLEEMEPLLEIGCTDLGLSNQMAPILVGPMRLILPLIDLRLQIYLRELSYEDYFWIFLLE